jgi:hypothetical protein
MSTDQPNREPISPEEDELDENEYSESEELDERLLE